jgi:hypothetical protein
MDPLIRVVSGALRDLLHEDDRDIEIDQHVRKAFEGYEAARDTHGELIRSREGWEEAPYSFEEASKGQLVYTEPGGAHSFRCGWGDLEQTLTVTVPAAEHWDRATPDWMHGRRDEFLDRLRLWAGVGCTIDEYGPTPEHASP